MRRAIPFVVALALVAAACTTTDTAEETPTTSAPTTAPTTAAPPETTTTTAAATPTTAEPSAGMALVIAETNLGTIVVDEAGRTLYMFVPDDQSESVCYDQCATTWPPFTDEASTGDGVDASLLGTSPRTDGSSQVTYNGWPLYYFAGDGAAGDTNGQGLNDVWYVISPAGEPIS